MNYVIVYINDDLQPSVYGSFRSREKAQVEADKMEADLDPERDEAGGGMGSIHVCRVGPVSEWEED